MFKTEKCGWGIRCLDDIPQGQFICVYTGEIVTKQQANGDGKKFGEEYFVDLDLIKCVENCKPGFESGVEDFEQFSGGSSSPNKGNMS